MTKIISGGFTKKQLLLIAMAFAILYFSWDYIGDLLFKVSLGGNSDSIITAVHSAKISPRILSHTGDITGEQYNIHKPNTSEDSATLSINITGEKANVLVEAHAIKQTNGMWKIYKSDTTFSN
jgi:hypothetical protein